MEGMLQAGHIVITLFDDLGTLWSGKYGNVDANEGDMISTKNAMPIIDTLQINRYFALMNCEESNSRVCRL
jgi:hypothetical protein